MNRKDRFVNGLQQLLGASDGQVKDELGESLRRLENHPEIFSGDPDGLFTFGDPILAVAAYEFFRRQEPGLLGANPGEGHDDWPKWASVAISALLARWTNFGDLWTRYCLEPISLPIKRIAIIGDAGFKNSPQDRVLEMISDVNKTSPFDLLIHLGDVYYGGNEHEFSRNLTDPLDQLGIDYVLLCGNHDLYYGKDAYLNAIKRTGQKGRFFSIAARHWRLACLDTSLPATKTLRGDGRLDEVQLEWLDGLLDAKDARPLVVFSHHFTISAWEEGSKPLIRQLRKRRHKFFAWYWGHEHNCATYGEARPYGACVGNGCFFQRRVLPNPFAANQPTWWAKGSCDCDTTDRLYRPHGFLELQCGRGYLKETYHLESDRRHSRRLDVKGVPSKL